MAERVELRFCNNLHEKYKKCKKNLMRNDMHYKTIEDIKDASDSLRTKSRHGYIIC